MKAIHLNWFNRRFYSVILLLSVTLLFQSCAKEVQFIPSSVVPAAEGTVKVKKDKNNNYNIALKVFNLADPEKLSPQKKIYIVWMETEQNGIKNIGQLKPLKAAFSKTLKSTLETVSSFKPTRFFITAEDNVSAQYPSGEQVLKTELVNIKK